MLGRVPPAGVCSIGTRDCKACMGTWSGDSVNWQTHLGVPPGGRVEFIVQAPRLGATGLLVTRTVDTGPGGENDPNRAIAKIIAAADAPEPRSKFAASPGPLPASGVPWLGDVARLERAWLEGQAPPRPPYNTDADSLMVAYYA